MPSYKKMRECIEDSLERLQLEVIDNFDFHGINQEEDLECIFRKGGCLQAVQDAIEEGLIRHLGFSTHGKLPIILKTIRSGVFESINLHYYYFFQHNLPAHRGSGCPRHGCVHHFSQRQRRTIVPTSSKIVEVDLIPSQP